MTKPIKAYAAKCHNMIDPHAIAMRAVEIRRYIGESFSCSWTDWKIGWKAAKKQGYRVVPVEIRGIEE